MNQVSLSLIATLLLAIPSLAQAGVPVPEIDGGLGAIAVALVGGVIALIRKGRRTK